jgi:opacity protein-like surface antigen
MNIPAVPAPLRGLVIATLIGIVSTPLSAAWSFAIKGGLVPVTNGDVHRGPAFDGSALLALSAGSLPVDVDAKGFDDVYGDFTEFGLEAAYAAGENLSYQLGASWLSADEGVLRVGTVAGALPLNGRFSDYQDFQVYGGVRYNFRVTERWNPYVALHLGYKRVDAIAASFSVPNTPFVAPYQAALTNAPFYDASNVWTYGVLVGLEYKVGDRFAVALETGYLDQGALKDNDSIIGLLGLNALNDEGNLGYIPVRLSAIFRF